MSTPLSPHRDAKVLEAGPLLGRASRVAILLHGRGARAEDILDLRNQLGLPEWTVFAPQAAGNSWYPNSFLAPIESNEPWLSSALNLVESLVSRCTTHGILASQVAVIGFSQGACLASEFIASYPQRYRAMIAFTGGLMGPIGQDLKHEGRLDQMPIMLSSGDPDPHVPWERVKESAAQFTAMGADVLIQRYPNRPHSILPQEIAAAQVLLQQSNSLS
jgi:phospholipase/carboxylesterase